MNNQSATRKLFLLQFHWMLTTTTFDFHLRIQLLLVTHWSLNLKPWDRESLLTNNRNTMADTTPGQQEIVHRTQWDWAILPSYTFPIATRTAREWQEKWGKSWTIVLGCASACRESQLADIPTAKARLATYWVFSEQGPDLRYLRWAIWGEGISWLGPIL